VFDAWINNYDVYGTGPTWNIFTDGRGNYLKMDFGGSLEFRAQGAKKSLDTVASELKTFPEYEGKNLIAATQDSTAVGAEMVLRMSKEDIHGALSAAGFEGKELESITTKLLARQDAVRKAFPDIAFHIDGLFNNITHTGSLKLADLWLEQAAATLKTKLTDAMRNAIDAYKGAWAGDINNKLWNNKLITGKNNELLVAMDEAMELAPGLTTDTTLWRWQSSYDMGLSPSTMKSLEKSVYQYKGFMSTSLHSETSMAGKDVLWRIDAESGVKGVPTKVLKTDKGHEPFPDEYEFIVDRNQIMVIDSVEKVTSWAHGNMMEHWQVNARLVNPKNLSRDADSLMQSLHASMADRKIEPNEAFGGDIEAHINKLVDDLYQARKPPEIPTLTDEVELKTPAMLAIESEINDLHASVKELDLDDLALKELEMADAKIKETDGFVNGLKQAWACMKGL